MKQTWIMKLKSIQRDGTEVSESELVTEVCFFKERNGDYVIAYEESEATGMEGSEVEIRITKEGVVSIVRTGTFQTNIVVKKGCKHFCHYSTPFGEMPIGVDAKKLHYEFNEDSGFLQMRYTVDANCTLLSDNEIIMHLKRETK